MKFLLSVLWLNLLGTGDAHAWGLYTHVWYAQALLWLVPLADPKFRDAVRRLPRLVMAGACLPDLALVQGRAEPRRFECSHEWEVASSLLAAAASDEERALALGYASHLLTDIYAHNHFVPAHERVWVDVPLLTHVSCEWALDHHVRGELFATPAALLKSEAQMLQCYLQTSFSCLPAEADCLLQRLQRADRVLRASGLPRLVHGLGAVTDRRMQRRFRHYLAQTVMRLPQINALIAGERPQWAANPSRLQAQEGLASHSLRVLRQRPHLPADVFLAMKNQTT